MKKIISILLIIVCSYSAMPIQRYNGNKTKIIETHDDANNSMKIIIKGYNKY